MPRAKKYQRVLICDPPETWYWANLYSISAMPMDLTEEIVRYTEHYAWNRVNQRLSRREFFPTRCQASQAVMTAIKEQLVELAERTACHKARLACFARFCADWSCT